MAFTLVVAWCLLAMACSSAERPPAEPRGQAATVAGLALDQPAATPSVPPIPRGRPGSQRIAPLSELAPLALAYLEGRAPQWGVAAALPGRGVTYVANGREQFPLASLAKVPVMLAFLARVANEDRELSPDELALLEAMIAFSDNEAASLAWEYAERAEGLAAFLEGAGLRGIRPPEDGAEWGDTTASAEGMVELLVALYQGTLLPERERTIALQLMLGVVDEQRWGVTAAFPDGREAGAIAMKNGWYPALTGWRVTSAGIGEAPDREPLILVVLSRNQESFETGVETIEGVAARIGFAVYGIGEGDFAPLDVAAHAPTQLVRYAPGAIDGAPLPAACEAATLLRRADAFACTTAEAAFDLCFELAEAPTMAVCAPNPVTGEGVVVVMDPLPPARSRSRDQTPWLLLFEDGVTCRLVEEDALNEDDDHATYRCDDGSYVIGPLQRSATWWAYRGSDTEGFRNAPITVAWS